MLLCDPPFSWVVHYLSQLLPDSEQIVLHEQQGIRVREREREKEGAGGGEGGKEERVGEREEERERLVSQTAVVDATINCSTKLRCMVNRFLTSQFSEDYS